MTRSSGLLSGRTAGSRGAPVPPYCSCSEPMRIRMGSILTELIGMSRREKGLSRRTPDGIVEEMTPQLRSTISYWWALGIVGTFAVVLVILLLAGVLGSTVWWTAA